MGTKNCGHKVPCGCGDSALTTPAACNTSGPCQGERCSELFSQECIVYTGEEIFKAVNGFEVRILKGERLDIILQRLLNALDTSEGVMNLPEYRVIEKTSTSITIEWEPHPTEQYTFNAEDIDNNIDHEIIWPLGATTTQTYKWTGLEPGALYHISVTTNPGGLSGVVTVVTLPS